MKRFAIKNGTRTAFAPLLLCTCLLFYFFNCDISLADDKSTSIILSPTLSGSETNAPYKKIIVTEQDIDWQKYKIIGDIQVQVSKFHPEYKKEAIKKLQMYALTMNADAVILVDFTEEKDFSTVNQLFAKGIVIEFE